MIRFIHDARRVVNLTENLLYLAGRSLQRRAMRNGLLAALAYSSAVLPVRIADPGTFRREQILGLLVVAFASYPAGGLLVRISNLLIRDNLDAAAAGYLHLTSHFKQSRMRTHLERLWQDVFRHESGREDGAASGAGGGSLQQTLTDHLKTLPADAWHLLGDIDGRHLDPAAVVERILRLRPARDRSLDEYQRYLYTGLYALASPMPLAVQNHRVGFDLGPLEDWYEKGLFTPEDFPAKAMDRDPLVAAARRLADPRWSRRLLGLLASESSPSFWYALTSRKYGVSVGRTIRALNRIAERFGHPYYFDAQHFTWPMAEQLDAIRGQFGPHGDELVVELDRRRRDLMRSLFSSDAGIARRHVFRLFARDWRRILELRLAIDPEYAAGTLDETPRDEIETCLRHWHGRVHKSGRLEKARSHARESLDLTDVLVRAAGLESIDERRRRTMAIAVHVNRHALRRRAADVRDGRRLTAAGTRAIGRALATVSSTSMILVRIRFYHSLVRIQAETYWDVVQGVATFGPRATLPERVASGLVKS
jgi:hypothetical protein